MIKNTVSLLTSVSLGIIVSVATPAPQADAQTFLDRLFGVPSYKRSTGQRRYNRNGRYNPRGQYDRYGRPVGQQNVRKTVPIKIKKDKGHTYFTYRLAPLKSASLVSLASLDVEADYSNSATDRFERSRFISAARNLANFAPLADKSITKAVVAHYKKNPGFLWVKNYQPTENALAVLDVLRNADTYGLRSDEYIVADVPSNSSGLSPEEEMNQLIRFELSLTFKAMRYAQDARYGRINPNRLSEYHYFPDRKINSGDMLGKLASAENTAEFLNSLHPQNSAYRNLKAELASARNETKIKEDLIIIKQGTFVRPGKKSDEFKNIIRGVVKYGSDELKSTYADLLAAYDGAPEYTEDYVELVKAFQAENNLKADGVIGRKTLAKMTDKAPTNKIANVVYALERLRWHPSNLGTRYVFINQPAYRATYFNNGKPELSMRTVVGKRSNQTNFFYDEIEKVVYNPYWGVPRSILVNEMLPKLRRDPGYLDKKGFELSTLKGKRVSSSSVNWNAVGANFGFNVRQPPGRKNALGELKILFPNKFAIYMHDTPARSLFKKDRRAYSHGCVRLQKPREMAAAVLGSTVPDIAARINAGRNATQFLKVKVPVYVAYFTAWPEADGTISYFQDVYGRDSYLKKAMDKTSLARAAQS